MIYTFKTRSEVTQHIHALCKLSSKFSHSILPLTDYETELSSLLDDLQHIKRLAIKNSHTGRIYIAFRTTGFESSTILHHFKSRITAFQTSLIACYSISYADGFYILRELEL